MAYNPDMDSRIRRLPALACLLVLAAGACREVVDLDPSKPAWTPGPFEAGPGLGDLPELQACTLDFQPVSFNLPGHASAFVLFLQEGQCLGASTRPGDAVDTVLAIYGVVPGQPDTPPAASAFDGLKALAFNDDQASGDRNAAIGGFVAEASGWHLLWVSTADSRYTGFAYLALDRGGCPFGCSPGIERALEDVAGNLPDTPGCGGSPCGGEVP